MSFWKWIGMAFLVFLTIGIGWFGVTVYRDYRLIRAGVNPYASSGFSSAAGGPSARSGIIDPLRLRSSRAPTLGTSDAPLTIVEFLDYDCPYCKAAAVPLNQVVNKYHEQVQLVLRDFPLTSLHPRAYASALAARCAQDQNKLWPYHDALYADQEHHEDADLKSLARRLNLDGAAFDTCYDSQHDQQEIAQDVNDGLALGVEGTPTFFFNGNKVQGAMNAGQIEALVRKYLSVSSQTR